MGTFPSSVGIATVLAVGYGDIVATAEGGRWVSIIARDDRECHREPPSPRPGWPARTGSSKTSTRRSC